MRVPFPFPLHAILFFISCDRGVAVGGGEFSLMKGFERWGWGGRVGDEETFHQEPHRDLCRARSLLRGLQGADEGEEFFLRCW